MPTTFLPANDDAREIMDELIAEYRTDLLNNNVSICLLFAISDKPGKPAMKRQGMTVNGWCRVNSYADRVEGKADATICLDGDRWGEWSDGRRRSLVHHELSHIAFCDGKLDELGRPALKTRYGDYSFDGFDEILKIYGPDSGEHRNLAAVIARQKQIDLPFGRRDADADDDFDRDPHRSEFVQEIGETFGIKPASAGVPSSVSFAGADFGVIAEAGQILRERA